MSDFVVEHQDEGMVVSAHHRTGPRVVVEALSHSLLATLDDGAVKLYGATRAGLDGMLRDISASLRVESDAGDAELSEATYGMLRRAAGRAGLRRPGVERDVARIHATPLVLCKPFLTSDFLADDAARFRPCRVALAHFEHGKSDPRVDREQEYVDALAGWRNMYRVGGAKKKTMNKTLAAFGEQVSPHALWGLRHLPLEKRPLSATHVELLGALGHDVPARGFVPSLDLLLRTDADTLSRAGALCLERGMGGMGLPGLHRLAHVLWPALSSGVKTFEQLLRIGIERWHRSMGMEAPLHKPPIPLPQSQSLRFIDTVGALCHESLGMRHCVVNYLEYAVHGLSFFFHIDGPGGGATAHVNRRGRIVEVRGPGNRFNHTVPRAVRHLRRWARGLWVTAFPRSATLGRRGFVAPRGFRVLHTVHEAYDAYLAVCRVRPDDDGALALWFSRQVELAIKGRQWLVQGIGPDQQHEVWVTDRYAQKLDHAFSARPPDDEQPMDGEVYGYVEQPAM